MTMSKVDPREAVAWAKVTQDEQKLMLAPFQEAIEVLTTRAKGLEGVKAELDLMKGRWEFCRARLELLEDVGRLVLMQAHLPLHIAELRKLIGEYFERYRDLHTDSEAKPVLDAILAHYEARESLTVVDPSAPASPPVHPVLPSAAPAATGQADMGPLKDLAPP